MIEPLTLCLKPLRLLRKFIFTKLNTRRNGEMISKNLSFFA